MSKTTKEKLDEMMIVYSKRIDHINNVIDNLEYKINALTDKKELLENETLDPLKIRMDEIISSMNHNGILYKNKYYGVEDLQGWAWYKNLGYNSDNLTYIDDNTFYINKDDRTLQAGQYLLIKDSKYGYMERYIKKVVRTGTITKVYLSTTKGPLSNSISEQQSYLSHMNLYPSCEDPGKMPDRTDCCDYDDKDFPTCEDVDDLQWKVIQTEGLEGEGEQQIEVQGGLPPYDWEVQNTNDFQLSWDQTEGTRNTLTYNYKGDGTLINVRDYCGGYIEEEIMPPEYDYLPGVFKIIIDADVSLVSEDQPVTIKISRTTGRYNYDLSFVFDEIGENWKKIYIQDSYPFNSGNTIYSSMHFWKNNEKIGLVTFDAPVKSRTKNIYYCYFGSNLLDNELIIEDGTDGVQEIFDKMYGQNGISTIQKIVRPYYHGVGYLTWWQSSSSHWAHSYLYDPRIDVNDPNAIAFDELFDYGYDPEYKSAMKLNYDDPYPYTVSLWPWISDCDPDGSYTYPEPLKDYLQCYNYMKPFGAVDSKYIDIPPDGGTTSTSSYTIEYFLYLNNIGKETDSCWDIKSEYKDKWLFGRGSGSGYTNYWIKFSAENGSLQFWDDVVWPYGGEYGEKVIILESNKKSWNGWTHIAFTHDWRSNYLTLYVNGELDKSVNVCEKAPWRCDPDRPAYPLTWISGYTGSWRHYRHYYDTKFLKTKIDETRFSHTCHSQERIQMHLMDMKDELVYFEQIAMPKRV